MWQDTVMMVGGFTFALALLPSVLTSSKPNRLTCLLTGTVLGVFAMTFATLDLWLSCIAVGVTASLWFVLLFQSRRYGKGVKEESKEATR